jgi:hypothetical protein
VSYDVEGVRGCLEALLGGELRHHGGDGALEVRTRCHVDHPATEGAEQVMVVMGEIFGELKACELVVRGDASNHAGELKVREVAIRRTARHLRQRVSDIRDAHGMPEPREQGDHRPAASRVALIDAPKVDLDELVEL